jgi:hypothetical protein
MADIVGAFVTYKFIQIITRPWEEQEAFKEGIVDRNGKLLRKTNTLKTSKERAAFTVFHKLVFNIKRLIEKLPFGKTKLVSFVAGLLLLKEGKTEDSDLYDFLDNEGLLTESEEKQENIIIEDGIYILVSPVLIPGYGEAFPGDIVEINSSEINIIFGEAVITAVHKQSGKRALIGIKDIEKR